MNAFKWDVSIRKDVKIVRSGDIRIKSLTALQLVERIIKDHKPNKSIVKDSPLNLFLSDPAR